MSDKVIDDNQTVFPLEIDAAQQIGNGSSHLQIAKSIKSMFYYLF